jgi:signal-transduction protein with cAMP-binding, CBS, and nucleotidyltransferase domain
MSSVVDERFADEAARFLRRFPPFDQLDAKLLGDIAAHVELRAFPPGVDILRQAAEPAQHLYLLRNGTVELVEDGHLVDELGEGELFGISVFSGLGPALTVRARDAVECYLIDPGRARAVMGTAPGLASLALHMSRWRERDQVAEHVRRAGIDDAILAEIGTARDVSSLAATSRRLPTMVTALLERGVDPVDIGHVVGITIDHLTNRLIQLFEDDRGKPPTAFAWIGLGSAARHEQALTTDQDHALAYGDSTDPAEVDLYFAALAEVVTAGLEACGIERCRGNVMAVNSAWRRTSESWRRRFEEYVADPDLMGARITGIAFDYRRVTGALDVEATLDEVIRAAGTDRQFVRRLATTALETEPPVGRRHDIEVKRRGEFAGRVDVKHEGIAIVTNLARVYAIVAGSTQNRTIERLRGAAAAGVIRGRTRDDLIEAFGLLWRIRLEKHAELMARGEPANDLIDPTTLPRITERALGGALRVIADAQRNLPHDLGLSGRRGSVGPTIRRSR